MSGWTVAGIVAAAWALILVFMLLGAAWNREQDEAGQRLFDRDNDPEGDET